MVCAVGCRPEGAGGLEGGGLEGVAGSMLAGFDFGGGELDSDVDHRSVSGTRPSYIGQGLEHRRRNSKRRMRLTWYEVVVESRRAQCRKSQAGWPSC